MKPIFFTSLFSILLTLSACSQQVDTVTAFEAERLLLTDSSIVVIDGRDSISFTQGHLPHAIHIDAFSDNVEREIDNLDKNKPYLVYCRTHNRSDKIVSLMAKNGIKRIYQMYDGYLVYRTNNLKIEK